MREFMIEVGTVRPAHADSSSAWAACASHIVQIAAAAIDEAELAVVEVDRAVPVEAHAAVAADTGGLRLHRGVGEAVDQVRGQAA